MVSFWGRAISEKALPYVPSVIGTYICSKRNIFSYAISVSGRWALTFVGHQTYLSIIVKEGIDMARVGHIQINIYLLLLNFLVSINCKISNIIYFLTFSFFPNSIYPAVRKKKLICRGGLNRIDHAIVPLCHFMLKPSHCDKDTKDA